MIHPRVKKRNARLLAIICSCLMGATCVAVTTAPCDKSRRVFTESSGIITDGPSGSNYTQDSHCEWLIKAQNTSQFITLKFRSMGTECSYDYVFVYDGNSFRAPLLGSFSGKTEPQQITASSGYMLILLYSDTNYVLDGFRAEFSVSNCPNNCSGMGVCVSHTCACEGDWGGPDCSVELCPLSCSRHGTCQGGRCHCRKGYSGVACSLDSSDTNGNKWHRLSYSNGGLTPRAAHSAVYINYTDSLYVFGGYDLNNVLSSLQIYRFAASQWEDESGNVIDGLAPGIFNQSVLREVLNADGLGRWGIGKSASFFNQYFLSALVRPNRSPNGYLDISDESPFSINFNENQEIPSEENNTNVKIKPSARYGHAACQMRQTFALYGGKLSNGSLSFELWLYDVTSSLWSLRAQNSTITPPGLTRHTLTAVNDYLYLFGGSTSDGEFSSRMFRITLDTPSTEVWEEVHLRGGKELDVRVVAHSAVYHSFSHSIIVYGGVVAGVARFSKLSDKMFAFDVESKHWSEIHYPQAQLRDTYVPRERAFHTATIIGNYLIVFGGYSHRHNKDEICYDNQMYMYHLGCHMWVSSEVVGPSGPNTSYPKAQGVFAHAAALRPPSTLLLVGGYHGNVNGDLLAFVMPELLSGVGATDPEAACPRHKTTAECLTDPECGWCSADEICYGRTVGSNCTTNLQSLRCGGICPALGDCHSCLIHGAQAPLPDRHAPQTLVSISTKLGLHHCTWCVQNARCHHKDDNYGVCGEDTPSQSPGWWGSSGTEVTHPQQCRSLDKRPGLTFIKYQHPANWSYPDHVAIINATTVDFNAASGMSRNDQVEGEIVARLRGFLHIPSSWAGAGELLRVCAGFSRAELILRETHVAANLSATQSRCRAADWPSLEPGRLAVDFQARKMQAISGAHSPQVQGKMDLKHNRSHENEKVFTFEYLEPFSNGSCNQYSNCLHCLTDSECGWCELLGTCISRSENETMKCLLNGNWRYLTLQPASCPNCSNYISCSRCVASDGCEWLAEEAKCGRRGRLPEAVKDADQCPQPCHTRPDCSSCLDERGRCVWCEATLQCFSFSVYTSEYQFGLCREWQDRTIPPNNPLTALQNTPRRVDQCKSCKQHSNCSSCLQSLSCGWCYSRENPIKGTCSEGDFGSSHSNCAALLDISEEETQWAYAQCPDVDECGLGLHDCHKEAVCTNTHGSYSCKCLRGFIGDGRTTCMQTCYNNCSHGYCLGAPDFVCQCDLGWTGPDCSTNCLCNNHSTCHTDIGLCDECQDWTEGKYCDKCKMGSHGNATSSRGCRRCDCNGHGDINLGVCNSQTGECFCRDNTEGPNCEKCSKDYYGDPRHGGQCFYQCEARGMLNNAVEQGLGSHKAYSAPWGGPPTKECLWIISPGNLEEEAFIQFTINSSRLNVSCGDNAVYAYDGSPDLVGAQQSQLIGVFCSDASPGTVEARSGHLTIHYKQGPMGQGFEGVYKIISCETGCFFPQICKNNHCDCPDGFEGLNCEKQLCPNNCSAAIKQGTCDKGYGRCICAAGWGGPDCRTKLLAHQLVFTQLFNSHHLADSLDHLRKTLPRFGHSLVADKRGSLWMFGGYSLSHGPLNDIRLFDTRNSTWMQVTVEATLETKMPEGRYFHAAEMIHARQIIYIYGGLSLQGKDAQNKTLGDFWQFSIKDQRWSIILGEEQHPPSLAGHTLTLQKHQDSESLVLIGGFSLEFGFLSEAWEFDLEKSKWEKLLTKGAKPIGICGHSTVYHPATQSLYVFGGYLFTFNGTVASNKLFVLHYPSLHWSELPTFPELNHPADNLPRARSLHSAVTTEDYMIVFGGRTYPHNATDSLLAYVYNCNQWIRLSKDVEIVGDPPPSTYAHAMTLDAESGALYVVGGWDGGGQCQVTRITLPSDLCRLWSNGKHICRHHMGCSFCAVHLLGGKDFMNCYSNGRSEQCNNHNGTLMTNNGPSCDDDLISSRTCSNFTTCSSCLASWPAHPEGTPACQWCSGCGKGMCVSHKQDWSSLSSKCETSYTCESQLDSCPETKCAASNCKECPQDKCIWTRQVLLSGEVSPKVSTERIYNWACVSKDGLGRGSLKLKEENSCPVGCHTHKDCFACLQADGGEGGAHECHWATHLNQCVGPSYQPLYCAGGVCGLVLTPSQQEQCPSPCFNNNQCAKCLRHAHCGWCGREGDTGVGVCTEGSLEGPTAHPLYSTCSALFSRQHSELEPNETISWHYIRCPPENECENGHHNCDPVSERCGDLPIGYECHCGPGHRDAGSSCVPVCTQGCVRGACTSPDVCECDFGYVGANCSIQCQCNGHAKCEGPDKLNKCLECHNNTKGAQCEKCKPLFVGDPTNNGQCVPCSTYCNGHSSICLSESADISMITSDMSIAQLESYLGEGPTSKGKCLRCANNTGGLRCDKCIEGNFRGSEDFRDPCRPCECHGHGDICDPVTGEKCNCGNNTESDATCQTSSSSKNSAQECWRYQCVKCKDSYMGDPKNGHQCYKMMTADNKMCFDAKLIDECKGKPRLLNPGQTVFFVVIPRFMNVDIRVIIDVTQGALDVFMSPNDSSFVISVNTTQDGHHVDLDPSFLRHDHYHMGESFFGNNDSERFSKSRSYDGNTKYTMIKHQANDLNTYITVDKKNTLLWVQGLRNRLVLTLPQLVHDLGYTKFYLILKALSTEDARASKGMIFFRQDQLHIDLFVFFSVFFSCFFLFLAVCVVTWKAKQAADVRRARRRHVVEMLHMAKRPFASVTLLLGQQTPPAQRRKTRTKQAIGSGAGFELRPVAVEPSADGLAAVTSVFVRLPGGRTAPSRLALGSTLVLLARQLPSSGRTFLRRRSVHNAPAQPS